MNPTSIDRQQRLSPWFVLLLALAVTVAGWHYAYTRTVEAARMRFENEIVLIEEAIQDRLRLYDNSLRGAQSLFATRGTVRRDEWRRYVAGLDIQAQYPGIQAVGFALRVPHARKAEHVASVRHEGFADYGIYPIGEREEHFPVVYIEPFVDRNLRAFGYDMYAEPVRRAAMEHARDSGLAALSGKVTLVQETTDDLQAGFLMYVPVYRTGAPTTTRDERRAALVGFVYSPFRMNDLVRGVFTRERADIGLQIYDGQQATAASRMYAETADDAAHRPMFELARTMEFGGRPWTLHFWTRPAFAADSREPELALAAGILISALLFAITRALATTRQRALLLARDMTEELRESREQFHAVAETANDAVISADATGVIVYFNRAAERIFQWSAQEVLAQPLTMLMPERLQAAHRDGMQRFLATRRPRVMGETIEVTARRRDGTEFPVEVSIATWKTTRGDFFTGILRDVTARKASEDALRKLNEELESKVQKRTGDLVAAVEKLEQANEFRSRVMESAVFGLAAVDEHGHFVLANRHFGEIMGYSMDELIGQPYSILLSPENAAALRPHFMRALIDRESLPSDEIEVIRKDGTKTIVVFGWSPMIARERVIGVVGTALDISAQKRAEAEIRVLNAELERRVKERTAQLEAANKELEAFSYSVSHDLRAPLRHIDGYAQMLLEDAPAALSDDEKRRLRKIAQAAVQMGRLIDALLVFSRMGRTQLRQQRVSMDALVRETVAELGADTQQRRIEWRIEPLPHVLGDPTMLRQVWMNLFANAVKYTQKREVAEIEVRCETVDAEHRFSVRDNGAGFDMRYADKLFGVFQRLHRADEFEGTGIGLANVRRIVQRHEGRVWAEAEVGKGATFYFTLPRARDGAA